MNRQTNNIYTDLQEERANKYIKREGERERERESERVREAKRERERERVRDRDGRDR